MSNPIAKCIAIKYYYKKKDITIKYYNCKKEFENTKGVQPETVNQRKTDKAMVKRKRTNNDLQDTTRKTKD